MKVAIIGCNIIRKDIEHLTENLDYHPDLFWLDDKLHDYPDDLHVQLQKKIEELDEKKYDHIILTYMLCGNSTLGIVSKNASIHFIKGADCIYATLSDRDDYNDFRQCSFFVSHGWLNASNSPLEQYNMSLEKYGEKKAAKIMKLMYKNYSKLVYSQLSDSISDDDNDKLQKISAITNLEPTCVKGSLRLYEKLFSLEQDEEIVVLSPNTPISIDFF